MDNHPITHKEIKFGKRFEQSRYVIKSKLSFGELVEIYCQLKERVLCQIYEDHHSCEITKYHVIVF